MEIAANEQLVRAREDGIRRIYAEICELNEMFEDIGELVSEQSGLLGTTPLLAFMLTTLRLPWRQRRCGHVLPGITWWRLM